MLLGKIMNTSKSVSTQLRTAGFIYLVIIICGIFSEGFVRSTVIVKNSAEQLIQSVQESEFLFRLAFASDLIMVIADIFIAIVFYHILKSVDQRLSLMAAIMRLTQAFLIAINLLNHMAVLMIQNSSILQEQFTEYQLAGFMQFFLDAHSMGYLLSGVFFGISCIIFGRLFFKADFIPQFFSWLVGFAGLVYVSDSFINFVIPDLAGYSEMITWVVAIFAEVGFCLWLLFQGLGTKNKGTASQIVT